MLSGWEAQVALAWMIVVCWACLIKHIIARGWQTTMARFIMGLLAVKVIWWTLIGVGTLSALILDKGYPPWLQWTQLAAFILNPIVVTYCLYLMFKFGKRPNQPKEL